MWPSKILKSPIILVFLALVPLVRCQYFALPDLPPLCYQQITLANHACGKLPYQQVPPFPPMPHPHPSPHTPHPGPHTPHPGPHTPHRPPVIPPCGPHGTTCPPSPQTSLTLLLPSPVNPPSITLPQPSPAPPPPSPPGDARWEVESSQGHHRHHATPDERECCRWLLVIDVECICQILVHLPPFISKPVHEITVHAHERCNVNFECDGRLAFP